MLISSMINLPTAEYLMVKLVSFITIEIAIENDANPSN